MTLSKEKAKSAIEALMRHPTAYFGEAEAQEVAGWLSELLALRKERERAEPDYIRYDCGCCGWETIEDWRDNDACPKCNHKPMGKTELYAAPVVPVVPEYLERLRSLISDPQKLPRRKELISGQRYSYVLLEDVEAMVDDACRTAMLDAPPAPPAPVVPEEATPDNIDILASIYAPRGVTYQWDIDERNAAADSWNACRAAMLAPVVHEDVVAVPAAVPAEITVLERQRDELLAALEDIIAYNIAYAADRWGDASKAETMACVRRSRKAIARAATLAPGKEG